MRRSNAWEFSRRKSATIWLRRLWRFKKTSASAAFWQDADDEDVHTLVIRKLKEKAGELADKIHTGRSRNDQVSLDVRLWLREEIDACAKELLGLMSALLDMANRDPKAIVPGYTHTGERSRCCGLIICWLILRCSHGIWRG